MMKNWALPMSLGAAAGAVAVLMLPRQNPARRMAKRAANKVEDAAWKVSGKINQELGL